MVSRCDRFTIGDSAPAQELRRQPRATPTPRSKPTPASPQIRTGVRGVWRLVTAIGAATANPTTPPTNAPRRSSGESHRSLARAATAAPTPTAPPTTAPTKSPGVPAALPRMEPMMAPRPANAQVVRNAGMGFKDSALLRKVVSSPNGSRLSCVVRRPQSRVRKPVARLSH